MNDDAKSIARLRKERADYENSHESDGLRHGEYWARHLAWYFQLKRVGLWWSKFQFPPAGTRFTLCYDVVTAIDPSLRTNGIRDAVEVLFVNGANPAPEGIPNNYVEDWIAGVVRVLQEVEAE